MELLKRHRVFLVALGLLLVLVFMLAWWHEDDRRAPSTDGQRSVLQEITRAVVLPFQQAVRSVSSAAGDVYQHYIGLVELSAENERLRERIAVLEETLNHHIDAALQFEALREQLRFQEEGPVRKVIRRGGRRVCGQSASRTAHQQGRPQRDSTLRCGRTPRRSGWARASGNGLSGFRRPDHRSSASRAGVGAALAAEVLVAGARRQAKAVAQHPWSGHWRRKCVARRAAGHAGRYPARRSDRPPAV